MDGVTMMPEVYVGYYLQDGPTDAQNGHDGQGQRYGHLWMRAKQGKPREGSLEMFLLNTSADLWNHKWSYCFFGGVVLSHDVQDPTNYELQEDTGRIPSGNF